MHVLEEKIDTLITVMERVAVAMEAGGGKPVTAAAATGTKAAATGKPAAKAKPKTTADALKAKFAELKARADIGTAPLKELISAQDCENLAALLVAPDKFDAAMEAMTALETAADEAAAAAGGADDEEL
jgi:hypothetical protein